ncbi:MAG: hypothetical protein JWR59_597 [Brevundimonas sp.]|nr:hypothetical protein [Brevundimonas sp.]
MTSRKLFAAAFAVLALGAAAATVPTLAVAQTSAQKALIDAAKADGVVGEQADGLLGFRTPSSDAGLQAAVSTTNAARRNAYAQSASGAGTSAEVAGARMFETLIQARIPAGQWYKNAAGQWVRK